MEKVDPNSKRSQQEMTDDFDRVVQQATSKFEKINIILES
jgi:hypothetical protein